MKKYFLALVMVLLSFVAVTAATSFGIGKPYGITPTAEGDLYMDTVNHSIWRANSTKKGDWSLLDPVVANGSSEAPFDYVSTNMIKLVPSASAPEDISATGTIYLDAASMTLKILTDTTGSGTWSDL